LERLFVYGSLLFPRVVRAVTGLRLESRPARLADHARYRVSGEHYPGLVPEPGVSTDGAVLLGLDVPLLARLDRFEGPPYERVRVVAVTAGGERLDAHTYVVHPSYRARLSKEPWDPREFERSHLTHFLTHYPGF
jgi:gamma-glutamylcyclotransferase (GGCT)/AIG2-like uncharacterized protein YtfP